MRTTLDKAGRVVIPAAIRKRAGARPGTEFEVTLDNEGIRLRRAVAPPQLVKVRVAGGPIERWIARPMMSAADLPPIDVAELVAEERERWP